MATALVMFYFLVSVGVEAHGRKQKIPFFIRSVVALFWLISFGVNIANSLGE